MERKHPHFKTYRHAIIKLLVLEPEINVFEPLPDGAQLKYIDISQHLQSAAQNAIANHLAQKGFAVSKACPDALKNPTISSVTTLFRAVNRSIQLHTFGPQIFPGKIKNFDYSVGSVAGILKQANADGLVLAMGYQSGSAEIKETWFSIAVSNQEGQIIWYHMLSSHPKINHRRAEGMLELVNEIMIRFWNSGQ